MSALAENVVVGERFVLHERVGGGAMGEVFRAHDRERGIDVALKVLRDPEPRRIYRFKREFRALADVTHPNLVRLHELVSWGDRWFFTMELVDGVDFLTWVRAGGEAAAREDETPTGDVDPGSVPSSERWSPTVTSEVLATPRARRLRVSSLPPGAIVRSAAPLLEDEQWQRLREGLRQLATGVQALHDRGALHRDIKPSNVIVSREGRVVLLDFGIISELSRPHAEDSSQVIGTPAYMAPEMGTRSALGPPADWYAVGVMMYEAMAGRRPFHGPVEEMLERKRLGDAPPVRGVAIEPPDDLASLCTELLAREPELRPVGAEILARLGASQDPAPSAPRVVDVPLVGREKHLAALRTAYGAVVAGEPRVVLVSGPSGAGKSTLVAHFLAEVGADRQAIVVAGRCYERESVPFKAVDDLVDNLCQRLAVMPARQLAGILPRRAASLARLFPALEQIAAVRDASRGIEPSDPHQRRRVAFEVLRELLVRLSARHPLVMHIDDAQWGDDDSAALLAEVFRAPYAPAVLLVVSYREASTMGRFVDRVREVGPGLVDVAVSDLAFDDAQVLADALLAEVDAPRRFAEVIARESGGNPLFVIELARYVASGIEAERQVSLEDIVHARVAALPSPARGLLELLAVAAWPVPRAVALAAADVADAEATINALVDARLIGIRVGRDGDLLETIHDRVRAAVFGRLSDAEQRHVHRRLAAALDGGDRRLIEHLALHLDLAGERLQAGHAYWRAGDAASDKLAFERAAEMYARAIELLDPSGADHAALHVRVAEAYQNAGKGLESAAAYLIAADQVDQIQRLRYRGQSGQQLLRAGHIDEGVATIRAVLAEVGLDLSDSRWRVLLSLLGQRLRVRFGRLRFVERSADSISLEQLTKIDICWTASVAFGMCDTTTGAIFQARHLTEALRVGEPSHVSHALAIEGVYRSLAGTSRADDVERVQIQARILAQRSGDPLAIAWAAGANAYTRFTFGHWRRACEMAQESLDAMHGLAGLWFERATVEMYRLWSLYWLGHFRELSERNEALRNQAVDVGDLYSATNLSIGVAAVRWLVSNQPEEGRRVADDAMAGWSRRAYHLQHYWHTYAVAHVDLYQGRAGEALSAIHAAWRPARRAFLFHVQITRLEMWWLRGRAALAAAIAGEGDRRALLQEARRCARALHRERRGDAAALALALEAGVLAARGERDACLALLMSAAERFREQEMYFLAAATSAACGRILGGEQGAAMIASAEQWMREQAIADPAALCRVFLPALS